jgi:hypothetical protein
MAISLESLISMCHVFVIRHWVAQLGVGRLLEPSTMLSHNIVRERRISATSVCLLMRCQSLPSNDRFVTAGFSQAIFLAWTVSRWMRFSALRLNFALSRNWKSEIVQSVKRRMDGFSKIWLHEWRLWFQPVGHRFRTIFIVVPSSARFPSSRTLSAHPCSIICSRLQFRDALHCQPNHPRKSPTLRAESAILTHWFAWLSIGGWSIGRGAVVMW